jgi:hypothetical protein
MRNIVVLLYHLVLAVGVPSLFIGPMLYLFRWDVASPLEKFINMSATFLIALVVLGILYAGARKGLEKESDPQARQAHLEKLHHGYRKLLLIYIPTMLFIVAAHAWFLLKTKS